MKIKPFATEHFYARYEFSTPYQLCNSDCETLCVAELLELAGVSLEEFGRLSLGYTENQGSPQLREAIASSYQGIRTEEVVELGTPIEGIYIAAQAVLQPGDEVVVLSPAYDALINLFEHIVGVENVKKWCFRPSGHRWELDFDELEQLITPKTRMLVINFPHNPTGYLPTQEQLNFVAETAEKHNLVLFCDEMYFNLIHSGTAPVRSAVELSRRAVILSGLSKTYGLPGLRTGWLVIRDENLRSEIINWKFYTSICPSAPSELLAAAAWKVRDQLCARSIAQIEHNLALADAFFRRWPDLFTWRRPVAGSTALVQMNVPSVEAFSAQMAQDAGILIQPASTLGWDDHHFRMGLGRAAFGEALQKFEEYLHSVLLR